MNRVIIASLNGNAYNIEEGGFEQLRAYLGAAEAQLGDTIDKREVIADLEQAIADKSARFLKPHKNVLTAGEINEILSEVGPVQSADGRTIQIDPPKTEEKRSNESKSGGTPIQPRRLYRLLEGAKLAGVCTGLAAFSDIHVNNVRGIFLIASCAGGIGLLAYVVLALTLRVAYTEEEIALAHMRPAVYRNA
jgi:phage shock protein PspC (stress-responsive transcriptional regulator)